MTAAEHVAERRARLLRPARGPRNTSPRTGAMKNAVEYVTFGSRSRAAQRIDGWDVEPPGSGLRGPSKHRASKPPLAAVVASRRRHSKRARAARRRNRP